jgi:hypothetical protein
MLLPKQLNGNSKGTEFKAEEVVVFKAEGNKGENMVCLQLMLQQLVLL